VVTEVFGPATKDTEEGRHNFISGFAKRSRLTATFRSDRQVRYKQQACNAYTGKFWYRIS